MGLMVMSSSDLHFCSSHINIEVLQCRIRRSSRPRRRKLKMMMSLMSGMDFLRGQSRRASADSDMIGTRESSAPAARVYHVIRYRAI